MAADGGRLRATQATQACVICKTRKKKCNKSLPSCGYCSRLVAKPPPPLSGNTDQRCRKELDCVYAQVPRPQNHAAPTVEKPHAAPIWGTRPPMSNVSSRMILSAKLPPDQTTAEAHQFSCPFKYLVKIGFGCGTVSPT